MPVEVVTIVNSSGKIISNGKNVWSVLKEAKASYDEKKAAIKAEKAATSDPEPAPSIKRSNTYTVVQPGSEYYDEEPYYQYGAGGVRRSSHDDAMTYASSRRSHGSRHSRHSKATTARKSKAGTALTEGNLKTLSEVSSTAPSRPPTAVYRSPYAETAPYETQLSRRDPNARTLVSQSQYHGGYAEEYYDGYEEPRYYAPVQRSRSDPSMRDHKGKEIDMNLAYGSMPPDLADRDDLDPANMAAAKERKARTLMKKIEGLLSEAQCLHHTTNHTIKHLQENPKQAASVALSLAELSALVKKMSPAFLAVIKGGSPAIFGLLSSPQFLIAAGVTAGVTVVMFGGWKIVQRIKEQQEAARALPAMAFEAGSQSGTLPHAPSAPPAVPNATRAPYPITEESYDEAIQLEDRLDEELSSIDSWRRGITPFGADESADMELISPEAQRAIRREHGSQHDDMRSVRSGRTSKTAKTAKSTKSHKSHKSHHTSSKSVAAEDKKSTVADDKKSTAPSERKSTVSAKAVEVEGGDAASEAGSHRSHRSHRSSRTAKTSRTTKTIEDGSRDKGSTIEAVLRPKNESMLKSMFKKKEMASVVAPSASGSTKSRSASALKLS